MIKNILPSIAKEKLVELKEWWTANEVSANTKIFFGFIIFSLILVFIIIPVSGDVLITNTPDKIGVVSFLLLLLIFNYSSVWHSFYPTWVTYKRLLFLLHKNYYVYEVIIPRSLDQGPAVMEAVLENIHTIPFGGIDEYDSLFTGRVLDSFSIELVGHDETVRMYIRLEGAVSRVFESAFAAYYPNLELRKVDDYMNHIPYNNKKWKLWGCEYELGDNKTIPIYSYLDIADSRGKKVNITRGNIHTPIPIDPLASVIESLALANREEHMCLQMIIRPHTTKHRLIGFGPPFIRFSTWKLFDFNYVDHTYPLLGPVSPLFKYNPVKFEQYDYNKDAKAVILAKKEEMEKSTDKNNRIDKALIEGVAKNQKRNKFEVVIRGVYISPRKIYSSSRGVALTNLFNPYNVDGYNKIVALGGHLMIDRAWQRGIFKIFEKKTSEEKITEVSDKLYKKYFRRDGFASQFGPSFNIFTAEELATIIHIPSQAISSSRLLRESSTSISAPLDIPTL